MRKLINDPQAFVDEMLEGLALAHPHRLKAICSGPRAAPGRPQSQHRPSEATTLLASNPRLSCTATSDRHEASLLPLGDRPSQSLFGRLAESAWEHDLRLL